MQWILEKSFPNFLKIFPYSKEFRQKLNFHFGNFSVENRLDFIESNQIEIIDDHGNFTANSAKILNSKK